MTEEVIVVVDLGHEDCLMIKEDVESFGYKAIVCSHDVTESDLAELGDIKGFILNGGPNKKIRGFRVDASQAVYDSGLPMYSVDHAGPAGIDIFQWPPDQEGRREKIRWFIEEKIKDKK